MASPSTVITMGFGSFGSASLVLTLGYGDFTLNGGFGCATAQQSFTPGARALDHYHPGAQALQAYSPGAVAIEKAC